MQVQLGIMTEFNILIHQTSFLFFLSVKCLPSVVTYLVFFYIAENFESSERAGQCGRAGGDMREGFLSFETELEEAISPITLRL